MLLHSLLLECSSICISRGGMDKHHFNLRIICCSHNVFRPIGIGIPGILGAATVLRNNLRPVLANLKAVQRSHAYSSQCLLIAIFPTAAHSRGVCPAASRLQFAVGGGSRTGCSAAGVQLTHIYRRLGKTQRGRRPGNSHDIILLFALVFLTFHTYQAC